MSIFNYFTLKSSIIMFRLQLINVILDDIT